MQKKCKHKKKTDGKKQALVNGWRAKTRRKKNDYLKHEIKMTNR